MVSTEYVGVEGKEGQLEEGFAIRWIPKRLLTGEVGSAIGKGGVGTALFSRKFCQNLCKDLNAEYPQIEHWSEWNTKKSLVSD